MSEESDLSIPSGDRTYTPTDSGSEDDDDWYWRVEHIDTDLEGDDFQYDFKTQEEAMELARHFRASHGIWVERSKWAWTQGSCYLSVTPVTFASGRALLEHYRSAHQEKTKLY